MRHHHLRIVHGSPTAAELAALTAVLTALVCRCAAADAGIGTGGSTGDGAGGGTGRRANWDRAWRPHPPSGSWRARVGCGPFHHH
ncbi:acyl-CoA carboxylase epsilon subunit [Streptomyces sp. NPDC047928]|uniref:acyl-CoA carboxylase epsilon subunit n=1 Tax=unclassified Streptomyces TaxID=2593676 RepID=UPI003723EC4E